MTSPPVESSTIERRSLEVGKWTNLFMAVAGVTAAWLSHADAFLVDGLYSGVNFVAAIFAARISVLVARPPDRHYPFGYDAHESLYVTFRSLVLLGIIVFAAFSAVSKIVVYATGGEVPELVFGPIAVYAILMVSVCFGLAAWHHRNWRATGRNSRILGTESKAAIVDGVVSAGAGGGLLAAALLRGTALGFLVPIADSIVMLVMAAVIVREPVALFRSSLRRVAGASADEATLGKVRAALVPVLEAASCGLVDVAVTPLGRAHGVVAYVRPEHAMTGAAVDSLRTDLETTLGELLRDVRFEIVMGEWAG